MPSMNHVKNGPKISKKIQRKEGVFPYTSKYNNTKTMKGCDADGTRTFTE